MTTNRIIEMIMIETIHPDEIAITDNPTGDVRIRMTEGPITIKEMRIIDHQIVDLMTTGSQNGLSNFNMIPETDNSESQDACQPQYELGESSASMVPNYYIYRKDGHYDKQCPTKDKGD